MMEYIKNAAAGWLRFNQAGKFGVLLLGVLLYLWYARIVPRQEGERENLRRERPAGGWFVGFAAVSAILAAVPVTGALLMMYQTRFYDYEWIWAVVPMTAMIAYGMTQLYCGCCEKYWRDQLLKPAAVAVLGILVIALCGNLKGSWYRSGDKALTQEITGKIMDDLAGNGNTEDICIWAPREVLENARAANGSVKLLYGRNMWDTALGAYSYDVYDPEMTLLYEWMEKAASLEEGASSEEAASCVEQAQMYVNAALNYGVNRILIPENAPQEVKDAVYQAVEGRKFGVEEDVSQGYVIFTVKRGNQATQI